MPVGGISEQGRATQGVKLIRLDNGDEIAAITKLDDESVNSNAGATPVVTDQNTGGEQATNQEDIASEDIASEDTGTEDTGLEDTGSEDEPQN